MPARSTKPLRIGIDTDGIEERLVGGIPAIANGGVGVYIYNLIKHLQQIDAINHYFLIRHGESRLDIFRNAHGKSVFVCRPWPLDFPQRTLDLLTGRLAHSLNLDLMHFPNQFGGAFMPARMKRVVTLHDLTPLTHPQFHIAKRIAVYRLTARRSLAAAARVIVDSRAIGREVVEHGFVSAERIVEVPLGVSESFRPGVRSEDFTRRYDLPARFILNVGVLEPRKNHGLLFELIRRLHARGQQIGLVLVGREGWQWNNPLDGAFADLRPYVRIFRDVPLADQVEFYNRAELFVYPSFHEGFGLPIAEAMACGTPVVTSNTSSMPQVAGGAALLADPQSALEFTAQVVRILEDHGLRERLIAEGMRRAGELTWRSTAERTLRVYEAVCGRASASEADGSAP